MFVCVPMCVCASSLCARARAQTYASFVLARVCVVRQTERLPICRQWWRHAVIGVGTIGGR